MACLLSSAGSSMAVPCCRLVRGDCVKKRCSLAFASACTRADQGCRVTSLWSIIHHTMQALTCKQTQLTCLMLLHSWHGMTTAADLGPCTTSRSQYTCLWAQHSSCQRLSELVNSSTL